MGSKNLMSSLWKSFHSYKINFRLQWMMVFQMSCSKPFKMFPHSKSHAKGIKVMKNEPLWWIKREDLWRKPIQVIAFL